MKPIRLVDQNYYPNGVPKFKWDSPLTNLLLKGSLDKTPPKVTNGRYFKYLRFR